MCTTSWIIKDGGYLVTTNRDENPERSGSNNVIVDNNRFAILHNGGFSKHTRVPPYRHSRERVLYNFFASDVNTFGRLYFLEDIEPFTIISFDQGQLVEFVWDGITKHVIHKLKDHPHLWSSCTLYDKETKKERDVNFNKFLSDNSPSKEEVFSYHQEVFDYQGEKEGTKTIQIRQFEVR